jgi:hypothetical protein
VQHLGKTNQLLIVKSMSTGIDYVSGNPRSGVPETTDKGLPLTMFREIRGAEFPKQLITDNSLEPIPSFRQSLYLF